MGGAGDTPVAILHRNVEDPGTAIPLFTQCMSIFDELADRRGVAVTHRNRGDAHRLAECFSDGGVDLATALEIFREIGDDRWTARTRLSLAGVHRCLEEFDEAHLHATAALDVFRAIGDRPAEGRALRELGMLWRDQGDLGVARDTFLVSRSIFAQLGDDLWTARVLSGLARVDELDGADPAPSMDEAAAICRRAAITSAEMIATVLREW